MKTIEIEKLETTQQIESFICAVDDDIAIVIATDSELVNYDIRSASRHFDDLGIDPPEKNGVYRWEGCIRLDDDDEWEYIGEFTLLYSLEGK